jgi:hypothetical protein
MIYQVAECKQRTGDADATLLAMANRELELSFRSAEKHEYELRPRRHDQSHLPGHSSQTHMRVVMPNVCTGDSRYNELLGSS